jgi:hypothetical protein
VGRLGEVILKLILQLDSEFENRIGLEQGGVQWRVSAVVMVLMMLKNAPVSGQHRIIRISQL